MSYSQTLDPFHPHSWVAKCFFAIGFIDGLSGTLLIFAAAIGLFLNPVPRPYAMAVEILAIVLLITSTIVAGAYVNELWVALFGENRFERYTFFHSRFGTKYAVFYFLHFVSLLLPQCFWNPRFRKSMLAVLLIAVGTSLPQWYERMVWISR